jgi:sugar lactone lactonase YvrE
MRLSRVLFWSALAGAAITGVLAAPAAGAESTWLGRLDDITTVASTVPTSTPSLPGDGDVNPYGVAVVDDSIGRLHHGDVLVSNFNDAANNQGTGTTIVEISPDGHQTVFARVPQLAGGTGLTTALAILPRGFVVVGSLPTTDGTAATATAGALIILNRDGQVAATLAGGDINGPWDLTAASHGSRAVLFFTNVLNGTVAAGGQVVDHGTVVRLELDLHGAVPRVVSNTVIGSGFPERTDPAALVIGPTGVGLSEEGTLYVADTLDNTIRAIPDALVRHSSAGTGRLVSAADPAQSGLNGPLGLAVAPNGDILTVNSGDGNIVETAPEGTHVASRLLDNIGTPPGAGALFGLALAPHHRGVYFVDDVANTLNLLSR